MTFAPLTGPRIVATTQQRTKGNSCRFMQRAAAQFPAADKLVLVHDNLNIHNASSFYEHAPAAEAFALAQRFEFHYTLKKASWLNIAALELSALSRICVDRRIGSIEQLDCQIHALVSERNRLGVKVAWQFTVHHARDTLRRHSEQVQSKNHQYTTLAKAASCIILICKYMQQRTKRK